MGMKLKKVGALGLIGCLGVGALGISAYFTDGDTATNVFEVGEVTIDLQEPSWVPPTDITPEQEFAKDPQVENIGVNDAYVFVEVKVPCANVATATETGTPVAAAKTQLFTYDVKDGWVLVPAGTVETDTLNTYVYAYVGDDEATMEAIAAGEVTESVFDYVRFANITEDQGLENQSLEMEINAYAIQTQNINDGKADLDGNNADGKVSPADVWSVVNAQRATTDVDDKANEQVNTDIIQ